MVEIDDATKLNLVIKLHQLLFFIKLTPILGSISKAEKHFPQSPLHLSSSNSNSAHSCKRMEY